MKKNLAKDKNWVHFIGIGGVAMAPLAKALSSAGYKVTGSDREIFEPMKSFVSSLAPDIKTSVDFSFNNLIFGKKIPGLVVCGSGISLKNKEFLFAKKHSIKMVHFPKIINEKICHENSIVVAGTYGKSTITSILVEIFQQAGISISYMFGALPVDPATSSVKLLTPETKYSIVEGDEYISARWDRKSKFFYYKPKFLVINAVQWDHTDIFRTEKEYLANFKKLVMQVPANGIIFANGDDKNVRKVCSHSSARCIFISRDQLEDWGQKNDLKTNMIGDFNYLNALMAGFVAEHFDISKKDIASAIQRFKGLKRRLEVRFPDVGKEDIKKAENIVIDDFASSPAKVKGSIQTIKKEFPEHKLLIVFEPNTGSRTRESLSEYTEVFNGADKVVLPKFTNLIKSDMYPVDEKELEKFLVANRVSAISFRTGDEVLGEIEHFAKESKKAVIAFMSSHEMEELIKQTILALKD